MKLIDFLEEFDDAPFTLEEFAEIAAEIEDDAMLQMTAKDFIEVRHEFLNLLEERGIKLG